MSKKNPHYEAFVAQHLPKVPDFAKTHAPKFDPNFTLGPPVKSTADRDFLDFYFNNDVRHIQSDIQMRPDHYTAEQKAIVEALAAKRPLPQGVGRTELNELVLRLMERTEDRKKRETIIQKVQKKVEPKKDEDPTIERILEAQKLADTQGTFENQAALPKAIKII
jgi:hypothetical protein